MKPALGFALLLALVPAAHAAEPLRAVIDAELAKAWAQEKLTPAAHSTDAEFLRRVTLDLTGTVPTAAEATAFLADAGKDKRDKLIDRLLADPKHARHQANVWDLTLFGRNPGNPEGVRVRDGFRAWLAKQFAANAPANQWVRDLLLAEQEGSETFYVQFRNQPEEATIAVSRIFLGTQVGCAKCHDHPFDVWTQKDFYGMAGFFVRLVVQEGGGTPKKYSIGEKAAGEVLFTGAAKDQTPGKKGEPVKARFLGGDELTEPPGPPEDKTPLPAGKVLPKPAFSRKAKLAAWVTAPENPFFAKAMANRVWAQFMGRGLVHPVDDFHDNNPPSQPELLKALTDGLVAHKYDLNWLAREIVSSRAYQLSSAGPNPDALPKRFERARIRPLSAEELVAAVRTATSFDSGTEKLPQNADDYFLRAFGEPTNGLGDFQGSLSEHLFWNNAEQVRMFLRRKKGNLTDQLLTSTAPWDKRVEALFLAVLSRPPSAAEGKKFAAFLAADPKPDARVEDAIWVLLTGSEFRFNH